MATDLGLSDATIHLATGNSPDALSYGSAKRVDVQNGSSPRSQQLAVLWCERHWKQIDVSTSMADQRKRRKVRSGACLEQNGGKVFSQKNNEEFRV